MGRNNRHSHNRRSWNNQNHNQQSVVREPKNNEPVFQRTIHENIEERQKKDAAIRALKMREVVCPICGKPIEDLTSAVSDKATGRPAHFDCILDQLNKSESLGVNDKITYIGQGRFAVLHFDNPRDLKSFKILKTIEWESREKKLDWREEMSGLYSQVL
ncbi:MAG: hypothetical protein M0P01_03260 [Treponema sp.]|nr:hypothetical protein [Treponema sp.]